MVNNVRTLITRTNSTDLPNNYVDISQIFYHADKKSIGIGDGSNNPPIMVTENNPQVITNKIYTDYVPTSYGNNNVYNITIINPYLTSYQNGQNFVFNSHITNTGACFVNVNGIGSIALYDITLNPLSSGTVLQNQLVSIKYYNGTFRLVNSSAISTNLLPDGVVTYPKIQLESANTLLGNPNSFITHPVEISLGPTLLFSSGSLETAAFTGDLTSTSNSFNVSVAANAVTYSKFQQITGLSVVGNTSFLTGNVSAIIGTANQVLVVNPAGTSLAFGQVATAGIAANAVTNGAFRQSVGLSVVGNSGTSTANVADIIGTANQVLVVNSIGSQLAFGSVNLASSNAVTGILPTTFGGTGVNTIQSGYVVVGNGSGPVSTIAPGTQYNILTSISGAWQSTSPSNISWAPKVVGYFTNGGGIISGFNVNSVSITGGPTITAQVFFSTNLLNTTYTIFVFFEDTTGSSHTVTTVYTPINRSLGSCAFTFTQPSVSYNINFMII